MPASAATRVSLTPPSDDPRAGGPGTVDINGDSRANDIVVGVNSKRGAFVVKDSEAGIRTQDCARLSNHRVRCKADPSDHEIYISAGNGNNQVHIRRPVPSATLLIGGTGEDVFIGGRGEDYIDTKRGNDRLKGRAGEDLLNGGDGNDIERGGRGGDGLGNGRSDRGVDSFRGGRGIDVLDTADGIVDTRIQCGRGRNDIAIIDPAERPRVNSCPRIDEAP
jgi:Ca2+-binding RTX toxin-like protein